MANLHVDDVGTILEFQMTDQDGLPLSLVGYTNLILEIGKPDGSALLRDASLVTDGSDGLLKYAIVLGDLDQRGSYKFQPHVSLPAGDWHGDIVKQKVLPNVV